MSSIRGVKFNFTVAIVKEEDWYVANCLENHVVSQDKSREEELELYYENNDETPNFERPFVTSLEIAI